MIPTAIGKIPAFTKLEALDVNNIMVPLIYSGLPSRTMGMTLLKTCLTALAPFPPVLVSLNSKPTLAELDSLEHVVTTLRSAVQVSFESRAPTRYRTRCALLLRCCRQYLYDRTHRRSFCTAISPVVIFSPGKLISAKTISTTASAKPSVIWCPIALASPKTIVSARTDRLTDVTKQSF